MARRNIHQNKKSGTHKSAAAAKPTAQASQVKQTFTATPAKPAGFKTPATQEAAAVRFAELPYELRRIALFSAFVVVLLLVLWFFLK
jgi:hypothetical protein